MNNIQASSLIHRSENFLSTELDGELVLMDIDRGNYYSLAKTAKRIWDLLEQPKAFADLCQTLVDRYDAPVARIEAEVKKFLLAMENVALVSIQ
jgi:hypothetical protein